MTEKELSGKTALVTGGSRGIGRAVCLRLAQAGARVGINYVANAAAARDVLGLVEAEGVEAVAVQADVADPRAVARMVEETEAALGPIDLLVTSAGIVQMAAHEEVSFEDWRALMAINLDGTFLSVMAVKDGMIARGAGAIVCIGSIAGLRGRGNLLAYSTSKAAVTAFARSCSEAFAPQVRINTIAPGLTETDMAAQLPDDATRARMIEATPLKRIGRPEEIAELAAYLLSDRAAFITGQTIVADGGRVTLP